MEPATLLLFLLAWAVLPGRPLYWTLAPLTILFAPTAFLFVLGLARATFGGGLRAAKNAFASAATGLATVLLSVTFLLHDSLVSTDAIWRSLYRRSISRQRLLEWETAAEAESGKKKHTHLDLYLLFTPAIALTIALWLLSIRHYSAWAALPIIALWGCSKLISLWLDRPPRATQKPASRRDALFLRASALHTWRYFEELSTEEHNWLVPDNVQGDPARTAPRISPTNLGLLLNARQVACELGYLTVPEFVRQTRRTLETMDRLRTYKGHLLNWYDTRSLDPLDPLFVSSVDSGNLAASLLTLKSGCNSLLEKPLLSPALLEGYEDHLRALTSSKSMPRAELRRRLRLRKLPFAQRLSAIIACDDKTIPVSQESSWHAAQIRIRREELEKLVSDYTPWLLPEFETLRRHFADLFARAAASTLLGQLPETIDKLQERLKTASTHCSGSDQEKCNQLSVLLSVAHARCVCLIDELTSVAHVAEQWFSGMDFSFLLNRNRKLLSIGYDLRTGESPSCYDLLASEARIATFVAIAKGDIPQETWFRLGRTHVPTSGSPALVSWTGTMFEYLMPAIWMNFYPDTLLCCSMEGAVRAQQEYAAHKRIPWGISESAYDEMDESGAYQYRAFGVPALSMQNEEQARLVVAPYATAMALAVNSSAALLNLQTMKKKHRLFGRYGFYEALDFGPVNSGHRRRPRIVHSWMAHHQGMTLLSIANSLSDNVVRHWFHDDVYVQATELLLQERAIVNAVTRVFRTSLPELPSRTRTGTGKQLAFET